jgi:hypothetical protein
MMKAALVAFAALLLAGTQERDQGTEPKVSAG